MAQPPTITTAAGRKQTMVSHPLFSSTKTHVAVGVHGIFTARENWTDEFRRWLAEKRSLLIGDEYDYGIVGPIRMYLTGFIPTLAYWQTRSFKKWYDNRCKGTFGNGGVEYNFVAHSYGTWLVHELLWRNPSIKINAVVLFGSVLSSHFKQTKFPLIFKRGQIRKLVVVWSPNDKVVEDLSQPVWGAAPYGHLGSRGFVDGIDGQNIEQVKTHETHGGYFDPMHHAQFFSLAERACV
jgi:hypothetical protein